MNRDKKPTGKIFVAIIALIFVSSFPSVSQATELTGKLKLSGSGARTANIADAIVYFVPDDLSQVELAAGEYEMSMVRKQFVPRTMAVPVGSMVNIPNLDTISHNAFSPKSSLFPNGFDLELYGKGTTRSFETKEPGVIRVYCNVHYHMVAYVLALETPFHTQPDSQGNFSLEVPDVPGKIVVWHERTNDFTQTVNPEENEFIEARLRITKRRLPVHNNKFGRSYRRSR